MAPTPAATSASHGSERRRRTGRPGRAPRTVARTRVRRVHTSLDPSCVVLPDVVDGETAPVLAPGDCRRVGEPFVVQLLLDHARRIAVRKVEEAQDAVVD